MCVCVCLCVCVFVCVCVSVCVCVYVCLGWLQVAMGSAEGFVEADRILAQALKSGAWVLLRNVHLCPEWLGLLEKRLHGLSPHNDFRLFLTCDIRFGSH